MDGDLHFLSGLYAMIREYRAEVVMTAMIVINPILTYVLTGQARATAWRSGRDPSAITIRAWAAGISILINFPAGIRWGALHFWDALLVSVIVAALAPWIAKGIMRTTRDPAARFHWVYAWMRGDRRRRRPGANYQGPERRGDRGKQDPDETDGENTLFFD